MLRCDVPYTPWLYTPFARIAACDGGHEQFSQGSLPMTSLRVLAHSTGIIVILFKGSQRSQLFRSVGNVPRTVAAAL